MSTLEHLNRRILVIDDEESVRDSFLATLCPAERTTDTAVADAATALFGEVPATDPTPQSPGTAPARNVHDITFEVDLATNGRDGQARVEQALAADKPYAVVFCDMRMPGWDGLETIEHIRAVDERCEVVFVTAYSDHGIEEIVDRLGLNLGYFLKPFATDELRQLAAKAVLDWNRARELEALLETISGLRGENDELDRILAYVLKQVCQWLEIDSAALVQFDDSGEAHIRLGIGTLQPGAEQRLALPNDAAQHRDDGRPLLTPAGDLLLPVHGFGIVVALGGARHLTADRRYLLHLFLDHAAMAIQGNADRQHLLDARRLASIGETLGFLAHDLRGPLAAVRQLAEFLRMDEVDAMPREEIAELLEQAADTGLELIGDTIDVARGRMPLLRREVDVRELLAKTLRLVTVALHSDHVELALEPGAPLLFAIDAGRLQRAVQNLCKNAAEALHGKDQGRVTVRADVVDEHLQVQVEDDGPGIPSELVPRLFEPFATKGKPAGTGFGLAIVREVARAHGGDATVDTGPAGTRFTVTFAAEHAAAPV